MGRFINIPINRGIPNETFVLKTYTKGGFLLPDKANIEMTTKTDENGFFKFADNTCEVSTFPNNKYPFIVSATMSATYGYLNFRYM